jgi:hypothetical protein
VNAQLTALLAFNDNVKEDRYTAKEWIEKATLHKNRGN